MYFLDNTAKSILRITELQNILERHAQFHPCPNTSIQIHHDNSRTHWLVSCADRQGVVSVLDSMLENTSEQMDTQKYVFNYYRQRIQQQQSVSDCGLFAAAVSTALAFEVNPSDMRWDQSLMRAHLSRCLVDHHLTLFSTLKTGIEHLKVRRRRK